MIKITPSTYISFYINMDMELCGWKKIDLLIFIIYYKPLL